MYGCLNTCNFLVDCESPIVLYVTPINSLVHRLNLDRIFSLVYGRPLHFGESTSHGLLGKATLPAGQLDLLSKVRVQESLNTPTPKAQKTEELLFNALGTRLVFFNQQKMQTGWLAPSGPGKSLGDQE